VGLRSASDSAVYACKEVCVFGADRHPLHGYNMVIICAHGSSQDVSQMSNLF
jgi:hypothetical protein